MSLLTQFYPGPGGGGGGSGSFPGVYGSGAVVGSAPDGILITSGATDGYVTTVGDSSFYSTLEMIGTAINTLPTSSGGLWFLPLVGSTVSTLKNITINSNNSGSGSSNWYSDNTQGSNALTTVDNLNVYMYSQGAAFGNRYMDFSLKNYPTLVNVTVGAIQMSSVSAGITNVDLDFRNNALSQASVNSILASVVPAVGGSGGGVLTLRLQGGTNSSPGAAGLAAKAALVAAGWTVTHN